jgi:hypothetical protein
MTGAAESDPEHIWFVDTASLLSMAVDPDIRAAVMDEIGTDRVVIVDVVLDELDYRSTRPDTKALARLALHHLPGEWIDLDSSRYVSTDDVGSIQAEVADGRPLLAEGEHLAESTIIALARQSAQSSRYSSIKVLLSEDFEARRVAASIANLTAVSIHGLLLDRVLGSRMSAPEACDLALKLHKHNRGPEVTESDFTDVTGRALGRVAYPPERPRRR